MHLTPSWVQTFSQSIGQSPRLNIVRIQNGHQSAWLLTGSTLSNSTDAHLSSTLRFLLSPSFTRSYLNCSLENATIDFCYWFVGFTRSYQYWNREDVQMASVLTALVSSSLLFLRLFDPLGTLRIPTQTTEEMTIELELEQFPSCVWWEWRINSKCFLAYSVRRAASTIYWGLCLRTVSFTFQNLLFIIWITVRSIMVPSPFLVQVLLLRWFS